jgi:hypothetical protein
MAVTLVFKSLLNVRSSKCMPGNLGVVRWSPLTIVGRCRTVVRDVSVLVCTAEINR